MDWDQLRFVLAISRDKTLSRAATTLGVTHTTVSRRLASFEEALGVRLFERHPDGFVATIAGEDLVATAITMEESVLTLESRVLGRDARLSGRLRITTVDALAVCIAEPMGAFAALYPNVDLEFTVGTDLASLNRREVDVALRTTNRPDENLVGTKVGRLEYAVYASRSLIDLHGENASLSVYPWIAWDTRLQARLTEARMRKHAPNANIAMRVDSVVVLNSLVSAGAGIAFMSCLDGDSADSLVRIRPIEKDFGVDVWLLTHADLRNTARIRAFMDEMGAELRSWKELWSGLPDDF